MCGAFENSLSILLMFMTLQVPPPDKNHFPLQHQLFENFYGKSFAVEICFP